MGSRSRSRALFAVAAVVAVACTPAAPSAPAPALPPTAADVVVAPAPPTDDHAQVEAQRAADAAVTQLASRLEKVEESCRTRLIAPEDVCDATEHHALATAYRGYYPPESDPRRREGRIDALPRIAGDESSMGELVARIDVMCAMRCDTARRLAVEDLKSAAVDACLAKDRSACAPLAKLVPPNPLPSVRDLVKSCEAACAEKKREQSAEIDHERRRPKTLAESRVCFWACMSRCTGGRIVPNLDGTYKKDPGDWCGTCDVSCGASCAPPDRAR